MAPADIFTSSVGRARLGSAVKVWAWAGYGTEDIELGPGPGLKFSYVFEAFTFKYLDYFKENLYVSPVAMPL